MFTPQQDQNPNALLLLGQLNYLLGISRQRAQAFKDKRESITAGPAYHGPVPANPGDPPAIGVIEAELMAEAQIQADLLDVIIHAKAWSTNDPTLAAQGVPLTGIDPSTGETIPIRPVCPKPKPYLLPYLRQAAPVLVPGIDPATVFFSIPEPLPAVTVKPGAPPGVLTPFG